MTTIHTNQVPESNTRRELRAAVTAGLRQPLDEIVRTLQRLALAQLEPESTAVDAQLLVRARALAHGLQQVIDELLSDGTDAPFDGREPQQMIVVRSALDAAAVAAAAALGDRNVVIQGAAKHSVSANPARFHELLTALFEVAAQDDAVHDLRVCARRDRRDLIIEIDGVTASSAGLDRVRALARSLGGTVERGEHNAGMALWLPQQRAGDA